MAQQRNRARESAAQERGKSSVRATGSSGGGTQRADVAVGNATVGPLAGAVGRVDDIAWSEGAGTAATADRQQGGAAVADPLARKATYYERASERLARLWEQYEQRFAQPREFSRESRGHGGRVSQAAPRGSGRSRGGLQSEGAWEWESAPRAESRGHNIAGRGREAAAGPAGEGRGEVGRVQRGYEEAPPSSERADPQPGRDTSNYGYGAFERGSTFGAYGDERGERERSPRRGRWQREAVVAAEVMTRAVKGVTRESTLREVAEIMRQESCGIVPVVDADLRLHGVVTDRDIVMRTVADGRNPVDVRVGDIMTDDVEAVTADTPLRFVVELMGERQIRRVPVVDRDDRIVGIISMGDVANRADYDEDLQDALEEISARRSFWNKMWT